MFTLDGFLMLRCFSTNVMLVGFWCFWCLMRIFGVLTPFLVSLVRQRCDRNNMTQGCSLVGHELYYV